ncbi:hypothetical protein VTN77DRAFT_3410 [Rasamsonia byssochlamydoides]|uniref:uncharacterized protein n=1 Tax=Rasamsonia byssochlamydoides TaxID=89139 RepID=UPI0037436A1C
MGKKHKAKSEKGDDPGKATKATEATTEANGVAAKSTSQLSFLSKDAPINPSLASLFEKSAGPVKTPSVQYNAQPAMSGALKSKSRGESGSDQEEDEHSDESQQAESTDGDEEMKDAPDERNGESEDDSLQGQAPQDAPSRKRKRAAADNLEDTYMQRIAREELKEAEKRRAEKAKKRKIEGKASEDETSADEDSEDDEDDSPPPVHETLSKEREAAEIDKANRTVFLGNVSNLAIKSKSAKKTLLRHLSSFLATLPESDPPHKIESIRFRSTAYSTKPGVPKRAAYAHKELMDATTPSTNAYVVYSTALAAQKAPGALNGTIVLDRHLRVDSVAHPAPIDHKRCVFVGNLDFVDQENDPDDDDDEESGRKKKKKKKRASADVEEGLWRTFNAHTGAGEKQESGKGNVESVRVVRDRATRVGKGFAYVQFYDPNHVEAALLLDGKKFPPMLPRKLRVVRAKKVKKKRETERHENVQQLDGARHTLHGRAGKLLGRAGAAKLKERDNAKPFVFEGQRATEGARIKVKTKSRGAKKGKPKNRSTRRAAAYRAAGGKPKKAK